MSIRDQVESKARELGFADIGFTTAEPFEDQKAILAQRTREYEWMKKFKRDLKAGTDPAAALPGARSIIVLLELYFHSAYPPSMVPFFGRCYQDDDRVTKDTLAPRVQAFRSFLSGLGITSKVPPDLPQRPAAARAGLGDYGKNCLLYAHRVARKGSWVQPIPIVVDREFPPDEPSMVVGCPDWCKNVCITACPTGALRGPRHIDPYRCISYLTYYGDGLTPRELREPMGLWIYGCDICQNICPRNAPWLAANLPPNARAAAKVDDFQPARLLHMDLAFLRERIQPFMFYMPESDIWRWQMNAARAMGNTRDSEWTDDLARAFSENPDPRVRAMCAWALGRIGGEKARSRLEAWRGGLPEPVAGEVEYALEICA